MNNAPLDILVIAVGVVPNAELVKDAGGDCNRGIVIDAQCKTSLTDVYAAGDCAEGYDSSIDKNRVLDILPNAYFQGRCAGINLAGEENSFEIGIPMNAVGFFGLHVLSAGVYEGECLQEKYKDGYKKLFVKNNRLVGFILIGNIARAGIYTSLIRNKTDLNTLDKACYLMSRSLWRFPRKRENANLQGWCNMVINIDENMNFQMLNKRIRDAVDKETVLNGCIGQRYIGTGVSDKKIVINGTPGNVS